MTIKDGNANNQDKFESWMIEKAKALFAEGESVTSVCVDLDITRQTYYNWRDNPDHPFSAIAKKGEALSQQFWERAGKHGTLGSLDRFSGSSWQFIMRNRFRDDYNDHQKETHTDTLIEKLLDRL